MVANEKWSGTLQADDAVPSRPDFVIGREGNGPDHVILMPESIEVWRYDDAEDLRKTATIAYDADDLFGRLISALS